MSPSVLFALLHALRAQQPAAPSVSLIDTAVLAAPRLGESSGVASSRRRGVYWTHNDSGDGPVLYATDTLGRDLGFVRVIGAGAVDWEDLAAAPCGDRAGTCLYIADTGDNRRRRPQVVIYRLAEPEPPGGPGDTTRTAALSDSIVLRYPDRPHDAEALAVTGGGWLLLVTKELLGPPLVYRARLGGAPGPQTPDSLGPLPVAISPVLGRLVTGAAVSPDGRLLVVRTYVSLHVFAVEPDGRPVPLGDPRGIPIPVVESQGEAVAFDGDRTLVLTSERGTTGHAVLTRLRLFASER